MSENLIGTANTVGTRPDESEEHELGYQPVTNQEFEHENSNTTRILDIKLCRIIR
jgi:hypothetical protein